MSFSSYLSNWGILGHVMRSSNFMNRGVVGYMMGSTDLMDRLMNKMVTRSKLTACHNFSGVSCVISCRAMITTSVFSIMLGFS